MNWNVYDGTSKTLPSGGVVMIAHKFYDNSIIIFMLTDTIKSENCGLTFYHLHSNETYTIKKGDLWASAFIKE